MILFFSFKITREQKEALLSLYPDIKSFVEKTISAAADKIIIERNLFNVEKELAEYHSRQILRGNDIHKRVCNQATKDKISKAQKGKHTGWHPFPETIEKIRLANIGKHSGPNLKSRGQKRTEETKRRMRLARIGMKYKKHAKAGLN